jgi:hypothetical protein
MNVFTIFSTPDPQNSCDCFYPFLDAIRKYPLDDGMKLYVAVPTCSEQFKVQLAERLSAVCDNFEILVCSFRPTSRNESWAAFTNRVFCSTVIYLPKEGDVLYIPMGWKPTEAFWGEAVINARKLTNKKFIGPMKQSVENPSVTYFHGPVVTTFEWIKKYGRFQLILAKDDPFFRAADSMIASSSNQDFEIKKFYDFSSLPKALPTPVKAAPPVSPVPLVTIAVPSPPKEEVKHKVEPEIAATEETPEETEEVVFTAPIKTPKKKVAKKKVRKRAKKKTTKRVMKKSIVVDRDKPATSQPADENRAQPTEGASFERD